ncbi:Asp-tRNA(Asn)/Glu-tRNA(Gln) amidotransferase subunit GatC [Mesoaciditoga sp.]
MKITNELIEHLENLAKIKLEANEVERIKKDMEDILNYMKLLDEVNVDGYDAMRSPVEMNMEPREDRPIPFDSSKILKEAPKLENNLIPVSSIHAK